MLLRHTFDHVTLLQSFELCPGGLNRTLLAVHIEGRSSTNWLQAELPGLLSLAPHLCILPSGQSSLSSACYLLGQCIYTNLFPLRILSCPWGHLLPNAFTRISAFATVSLLSSLCIYTYLYARCTLPTSGASENRGSLGAEAPLILSLLPSEEHRQSVAHSRCLICID